MKRKTINFLHLKAITHQLFWFLQDSQNSETYRKPLHSSYLLTVSKHCSSLTNHHIRISS